MKKGLKKIAEQEKILNSNDRKYRGKTQRIFMVLTHEVEIDNERKYDVMGTTGNVYTVTINKTPTCTCPDHMTRYRRCKHIFFVLTRIMKVLKEEEDIKEYSPEDLERMFDNIPDITKNLMVNSDFVTKYKKLKKNKNGEVDQKEIDEDTDCPICLDAIDNGEDLDYCRYTCGASIHRECLSMYYMKNPINKCLFCQQPWVKDVQQTYVNLEK